MHSEQLYLQVGSRILHRAPRPQTYGLFTSSVILYLNLCRVPDDQVEKAASDVQRGINALRYASTEIPRISQTSDLIPSH